jgi:hypothetical protein
VVANIIIHLCVKTNLMENQTATLSRARKKMHKEDSSSDYAYYRIGLFTFIVFVLAISTLIVINISSLLS